jgi:uncharacterized protein
MKWFHQQALILAVFVCAVSGCKPATPPVPPASSEPALPTKAQPKLQTMKLWMGPEEVTAELALTSEQIHTGMMFRTNVPDNEGMLFVFDPPYKASFWMTNCPHSLSAAYIDPQGVILEVRHLEAFNAIPEVAKTDRVQFVLEMDDGWFDRKGIKPGTLIRTERGTLHETFFGGNR